MTHDVTRQAAALATDQAIALSDSRRIDTLIQKRANSIGDEILGILDRGPDLSPADATKLLRLWLLRSILLRDDQVKELGRNLKEIRDVLGTSTGELGTTEVNIRL